MEHTATVGPWTPTKIPFRLLGGLFCRCYGALLAEALFRTLQKPETFTVPSSLETRFFPRRKEFLDLELIK